MKKEQNCSSPLHPEELKAHCETVEIMNLSYEKLLLVEAEWEEILFVSNAYESNLSDMCFWKLVIFRRNIIRKKNIQLSI